MSSNPLLDLLDPKFPLVYKDCLPKNEHHFQMSRAKLSRECAICERPFTVFFWKVNDIPYRTCICQICAKSANVCQVTLLDLDIGIPVQIRNAFLHQKQEDYRSKKRLWFYNRLLDKKIDQGEDWLDKTIHEQVLTLDPALVARARQLVEDDPYLSFKKAPVCQQWLSNACIHGDACHYSHELPKPGQHCPNWTKFGIRGRYFGNNDPNSQHIMDILQRNNPNIFGKKEQQIQEEEKPEEKQEIVETQSLMTPPADLDDIPMSNVPVPFEGCEIPEGLPAFKFASAIEIDGVPQGRLIQ